MGPQATPLLVSILTKDGLDAGPLPQDCAAPLVIPPGAQDVSGAQPLGAWVVTLTLVFG